MSDDEWVALVVCVSFAVLTWVPWLFNLVFCARRASRPRDRWTLYVYPLLCLAVLAAVLRRYASSDVRDSPLYLAFYLTMGAGVIGLAARHFLDGFGLSPRDDVIERGNRAAGHAIGGALLGITLCFAGANAGDGPGWWVVVFSGALSTVSFFVLWAVVDRLTRLADAVTVDRDPASGFRLAGYFLGAGLILGRAVAGDWVSATDTVADFGRLAWPVLLLAAAVVLLEPAFRPTPERPRPSMTAYGLAPGAAFVALAAFFVAQAGWWS